MRRSICFCEPNIATAGEVNNWKFIYTTAAALPKGTRFKFDLGSKGRPIDWEIPTTNLKKASNVIYAQLENGKVIQATEVESTDKMVPDYEFILPSEVAAGSQITVVVGAPKEFIKKGGGSRAQTNAQRRRTFLLYIDPTGKKHYEDHEVFSLDVRGSDLSNIRIITPSFVMKNRRFDVIVRFEDEFGNLTNNAPEDTLIDLSYESFRENLNWKLFVPETGFITLPNLYFNEAGVYTIQLRNQKNGLKYRSAPIKCFADSQEHLFWGLLHGESERVDSTENIESCMRHFRDEKAFNFFATSSFESIEETPNEIWKTVSQNVIEFNEDDRFTTYQGFQYFGTPKEEGLRDVLLAKEAKTMPRKKDAKYNSLKKMYKAFNPKEIISIPSFTMGKGFEFNFQDYNPEFERVVEIYNAWGSSERTAKEGNPFPIKTPTKSGVQESVEGSVQKALQNNCRFGFVAGGLDDRGIYAELYDSDQVQYSPGLTGIMAKEHSRDSIFDALYNRSCYATTGERMILGFAIAGATMGKELSTAEKQGLMICRHISGYAAGTTDLVKVEIIRNGDVIKVFEPKGYSFEFSYDDMDLLEKVAIKGKDKRPPFVYYYIRVTQKDGNVAWASPIWIDILPPAARPEARRPAKPTKKVELEEFEEEVEEEEEDDFDFDDIDDEEDEDEE
jgi:hypothetical protein